jgi:hypothetical protein
MMAAQADGVRPADHQMGCDASSDLLRQSARCTKYGRKGEALKHPSWAGMHIGFKPFPMR